MCSFFVKHEHALIGRRGGTNITKAGFSQGGFYDFPAKLEIVDYDDGEVFFAQCFI